MIKTPFPGEGYVEAEASPGQGGFAQAKGEDALNRDHRPHVGSTGGAGGGAYHA